MKTTFLALVLLAVLCTKPLLGAAGPAPEQVVDTTGKKVRAGVSYYIVPASREVGGGLSLTSIGELWTCPLDVIVVDGYSGLSLMFNPVNIKKGVVRDSTDLNIYFPNFLDCPDNTTVWRLKDYDYSTGQWFVSTGGAYGNPGRDTVGNWFKIEKYEDAYKLSYCPSVCSDCSYPCMDVGIFEDQNGKRLALSYAPYKVRFQLA